MRSSLFWSVLAILALAVAARAEDAYTIKLKPAPDVGKTITVKDSETNTHSDKVTGPDGNVLEDGKKHTVTLTEVYTETVLEKGDKVPNKYKRTFEKATQTVDGKTEARSYEGLTLVFEKKEDKFTVTAEGDKPLSKGDLAGLTHKANANTGAQDELFRPSKPVKVGDTWKIEGKKIAESMPGGWDAEKSTGEGKLTKAYEKDGHQFGIIVLTLKLVLGTTPKGVTFEKPPVTEMKVTLDAAIDGTSAAGVMTITASSTVKGTNEQMGKKFAFESSFEFTTKKEQSIEK